MTWRNWAEGGMGQCQRQERGRGRREGVMMTDGTCGQGGEQVLGRVSINSKCREKIKGKRLRGITSITGKDTH